MAGSGRFTIKRHPTKYVRAIKCPSCKGLNVVSVEADRVREKAKQFDEGVICKCYAIPFPHKKGTLRFCEHHPKIDDEPTEDENHYYQALLETPRSA